jgi:hypothetical protein
MNMLRKSKKGSGSVPGTTAPETRAARRLPPDHPNVLERGPARLKTESRSLLDEVDLSRHVRGHLEADFLLTNGRLHPGLHIHFLLGKTRDVYVCAQWIDRESLVRAPIGFSIALY